MSKIQQTSISRRGALQGLAVATAGVAAGPALATGARAMGGVSADGLRSFNGQYALPGGRIVAGYFVASSPVMGVEDKRDVVIVLHGEGGLDASALAMANGYARAGKMVIVPDIAATYSGAKALAGRDAHIADLQAMAPAFGKKAGANGKVEYVSA